MGISATGPTTLGGPNSSKNYICAGGGGLRRSQSNTDCFQSFKSCNEWHENQRVWKMIEIQWDKLDSSNSGKIYCVQCTNRCCPNLSLATIVSQLLFLFVEDSINVWYEMITQKWQLVVISVVGVYNWPFSVNHQTNSLLLDIFMAEAA